MLIVLIISLASQLSANTLKMPIFFFFNCALSSGVHVQIMLDSYIGIHVPWQFAASIPRHLHWVFLLMLSLPNLLSLCCCSPSPLPPNRPQCVMFPFWCPCVLIVPYPPLSENMQSLVFCSGVSLPRMMVSRFIHVSRKDMNSFGF